MASKKSLDFPHIKPLCPVCGGGEWEASGQEGYEWICSGCVANKYRHESATLMSLNLINGQHIEINFVI